MLTPAIITLVTTVFLACAVEAVEAFTIVLAMGITRGWRAALIGVLAALVALGILTAAVGVALTHFLSAALLQFVIGALLLVFGLQWLRKAVLRSSGLKAIHDEEKAFKEEQELAAHASHETHFGLDWFAFVVSFKGVLLEGLEVVFIVITFGLKAQTDDARGDVVCRAGGAGGGGDDHDCGGDRAAPAVRGAGEHDEVCGGAGAVHLRVVLVGGGAGILRTGTKRSLVWPGGEWALLGVLAGWLVLTQVDGGDPARARGAEAWRRR